MSDGKGDMNERCEDLQELLALRALNALAPDEDARVARHLAAGCPRCAAELAAATEALAMLPYALPEEKPSESAKARLLARVRAETAASPAPVPVAAPVAAPAMAWWRIAAAVLFTSLISVYATGTYLAKRHAGELAALRSQLDAQTAQLTSLQAQMNKASRAIRMASAPGVHVLDLAGQQALQKSSARVFWDPKSESWQLYAANLPAPAAGKTYQLWLITPTQKISAGTFTDEGTGQVVVPADAGTVVAAAVTDEPEGGSPQPTGSILLLGKI